MKAKYHIWLVSLFCLLAILLTSGCESSAPREDAKKDDKKEQKQVQQNNEQPQGEENQVAGGETHSPQEELNQYAEKLSIQEQQKRVYLNDLLQNVKDHIARHEYKTANLFLEEAKQVDPTHPEVVALERQIESYLGDSAAQSQTSLEEYEKELQVKIQQAKVEARNAYKRGVEKLKEKEYDQAIRAFESSLQIIKWAPYQLNMAALQKQAETKLKQARVGKERWLAKLRQEKMREAQREAERLEAEEQARRQMRVRILLSRAVEYYSHKKYDDAETLLQEILEIDPANKKAHKLIQEVEEARYSHVTEQTLARRVRGWKEFIAAAKESSIPYSAGLSFPEAKTWHEKIAKRKGVDQIGFSEEEREKSEAEREIIAKLESVPITLNFKETPFQDVIRFIQTTANINMVVDPKVIKDFEIEGVKVNLNVKDLKLKTALNILLEFYNLVYVFRNDVLFITRKDSELAKGKTITALHDIRDLTVQIKDFPGPVIRLLEPGDRGSEGSVFEQREEGGGPILTGERLTELIRSSVAPDSWESEENSIAETSGKLLVVNTEQVQEEVRRFLADMRRFSGLMVAIEARFLTVTDDFIEDIGVEWRGIGDEEIQQNQPNRALIPTIPLAEQGGGVNPDNGGQGSFPSAGIFFQEELGSQNIDARGRTQHVDQQARGDRINDAGGLALELAYLDDLQLNAVLQAVKKNERTEILTAPRITTFNTQRAHLSVVNQRSYIQDFDVEVAQSAYIADPIIGTIQDGVVLDVKPTISHDRKYITLELRPAVAVLGNDGDFTELNTTLGGVDQVTIEIPELTLQSVETTVRVPDGGTVLIAGFKDLKNIDRKQDVPFLGDIPVVGFFFSRRTKIDEKRQTLILVKARIIDLAEEEEKAVGISR